MKMKIQFLTTPEPPQVAKCRHCGNEYGFTASNRPALPMCWNCTASALDSFQEVGSTGRYRTASPRDYSKPFSRR